MTENTTGNVNNEPIQPNASIVNNESVESSATALGIWDQEKQKGTRKFFPKQKKRWGLVEVLNSLVILLVLNVIMLLGIMFYVTAKLLPGGLDPVESATAIQDETMRIATQPLFIILSSALMYISWVGMMWYSTRFRGLKSFAKDFGLKFKWKKDILLGLALAIGLFAFVQGTSALLGAAGFDLSGADNTEIFKGHGIAWTIILMIGMVGIVGPFMEELFFRGFLLQGLIRHFRRGNVHEPRSPFGATIQQYSAPIFNTYLAIRNFGYKWKYVISIILSSAFFGMMHFTGNTPGGWLICVITGTLGLSFGIIAVKTQRLGISIFGHIFYNSIVAIAAMSMM